MHRLGSLSFPLRLKGRESMLGRIRITMRWRPVCQCAVSGHRWVGALHFASESSSAAPSAVPTYCTCIMRGVCTLLLFKCFTDEQALGYWVRVSSPDLKSCGFQSSESRCLQRGR